MLTEAQSICCGDKKWKPLTSPGVLIREGFLEVVTFSLARKYKQAFVRWRGEGKEGNSSLREREGDGRLGLVSIYVHVRGGWSAGQDHI